MARHHKVPTDFNADKPSKNLDAHDQISNIEDAMNKAKPCM